MELDNFIIGKNRGEESWPKKATGACQKNRAAAAKHRVEERRGVVIEVEVVDTSSNREVIVVVGK